MPKEKHDRYSAERVARQFDTLHRISAIIQKELRGKETFNQILEEVNDAVDFSSASISIFNPDGNYLEEIARIGRKGDLISFVKFDLGTGFSSWVAKYGRPILMPSIKRHRESLDDHIRSFISVPIIVGDRLVGVLNVGNERTGSYNESDLKLIQVIASQIAVLIERISPTNTWDPSEKKGKHCEAGAVRTHKRSGGSKTGTAEDHINRIQKKISEPIAAINSQAKSLRLTLKGTDQRLDKSLGELEDNINKISESSARIMNEDEK